MAKLIPRITDLRVGGTLRVILAPLCDTIPCFGAAVISLRCLALFADGLPGSGMCVWGLGRSALWLERVGPGGQGSGSQCCGRMLEGAAEPLGRPGRWGPCLLLAMEWAVCSSLVLRAADACRVVHHVASSNCRSSTLAGNALRAMPFVGCGGALLLRQQADVQPLFTSRTGFCCHPITPQSLGHSAALWKPVILLRP